MLTTGVLPGLVRVVNPPKRRGINRPRVTGGSEVFARSALECGASSRRFTHASNRGPAFWIMPPCDLWAGQVKHRYGQFHWSWGVKKAARGRAALQNRLRLLNGST